MAELEGKDLKLKVESAWDILGKEGKEAVFNFNEDYKAFLDAGKTERECVKESVRLMENVGFKNVDGVDSLKAGDKVYKIIKNKGIVAAVIGSEPVINGFNILGAHIDSPRLDLKPNPLYEDGDMALLKTHYYGGIKKYQWSTVPLSMHGVICNEKGEKHEVNIGEKAGDPVFCINELLIHLSSEQLARKAAEAVKGEELNVLFAGMPCEDKEEKARIKTAALMLLNECMGVKEKDFISAEIEMVPAVKASDVGLDRSFIGAYGQDDRVCAYTALRALMDMENPMRTSICLLSDKEEVGSGGNSGAQSRLYENALFELLVKADGKTSDYDFRKCIENSVMLSSDVTSAFDPTFASAYDKKNSSFAGKGVCLCKYTGARGKSGANDASAEFFDRCIRLFDKEDIPWQTGELGKIDIGGGGTIAVYMGNLGLEVIDCGVPVLSMHAPFEVTSKADVYSTYLGFAAFLKYMNRE